MARHYIVLVAKQRQKEIIDALLGEPGPEGVRSAKITAETTVYGPLRWRRVLIETIGRMETKACSAPPGTYKEVVVMKDIKGKYYATL